MVIWVGHNWCYFKMLTRTWAIVLQWEIAPSGDTFSLVLVCGEYRFLKSTELREVYQSL